MAGDAEDGGRAAAGAAGPRSLDAVVGQLGGTAEDHFRVLLEHVPDAVWAADATGRLLFVSPRFEALTGYAPAEVEGTDADARSGRVHPDDVAAVLDAYAALFRGGAFDVEYRYRRKDGRWVWLHDRAVGTYERGGERVAIGVTSDVTERRQAIEQLRETLALQRAILDGAAHIILSTDPAGVVVTFNPAAERLLGYPALQVVGRMTPLPFFDPSELEQRAREGGAGGDGGDGAGGEALDPWGALVARARRGEPDEREWTYVRHDGTRFPVRVSITALRDAAARVTGYVAIATDITESRRVAEALRDLSLSDDLTRLRNRRGFTTLAEQQLKLARRQARLGRPGGDLYLFYADMDGLKAINDRYGHAAGSELICECANVLTQSFRNTDIIARLGGDEFTVLAVNASPEGPDTITARLDEHIRAYNARRDHPYELSLSVGFTRVDPSSTASVADLLDQADRAMYEQKRRKQLARGQTPIHGVGAVTT